jgi:hypothetical protein
MSFWVAGATAVVGIGSAVYGADAAKDAARTQGRSADAAIGEQQRQFDTMLSLSSNQRAIGNQALNALGGIYGYTPAPGFEGNGLNAGSGSSEWILSQGGVPQVNPQLYATDPAYRYAWDKTLEDEKANRPGWNGQETYWARGTNADWTRLNELMARNMAEYGANNPTPQGGGNQLASPDYSAFYQSPDYQFRMGQGLDAVQGSAAAQGGLYSGNALRGINDYAQGTAAGEFGNYVNRQLALAGMGQAATTQAGGAAMQTGANVGNLLMNQGNARASGIMGQSNAIVGGANDLASIYGAWRGGYFGGGAGGEPASASVAVRGFF